MDSVCIQAELEQASFLFPGSQVGLLGGFIKDVDHMFVSAIAVSRARANRCVIAKLVEDMAALGELKVLFKKRGAEAMLESRAGDVLDSSRRKETEDHQ